MPLLVLACAQPLADMIRQPLEHALWGVRRQTGESKVSRGGTLTDRGAHLAAAGAVKARAAVVAFTPADGDARALHAVLARLQWRAGGGPVVHVACSQAMRQAPKGVHLLQHVQKESIMGSAPVGVGNRQVDVDA